MNEKSNVEGVEYTADDVKVGAKRPAAAMTTAPPPPIAVMIRQPTNINLVANQKVPVAGKPPPRKLIKVSLASKREVA